MEHLKIPAHGISIHALLAESDVAPLLATGGSRYFYPRSPCGERRPPFVTLSSGRAYFYPRSPCGERLWDLMGGLSCDDFYPRSPCGERPVPSGRHISKTNFYPRSPCGERHSSVNTADQEARFLSTLSLRRATILHMAHLMEHLFLSTLSLRRATSYLESI